MRRPLRPFALSAVLSLLSCTAVRAEPPAEVPAPVGDTAAAPGVTTETAVLAGGCFWGVQGVFQHVQGVANAVSGYAGGSQETAHYETVGSGSTGHAEAVRITYDPRKVSYGELLRIFFSVVHDPTEKNRQGPDTGTQYRSAIFPTNAEQLRVARGYIDQLNRAKTFGRSLATTVEPSKPFYPAETYHQDFLTLNPDHPYIVVNDLPKVANLKKRFPARYQAAAVLTGMAKPPRGM